MCINYNKHYICTQQTNTYKMETYTITKEEYNQLLSIKCHAKLLAVTMNTEAQGIVNGLCADYDKGADIRLKKVLADADELINKLNNENRH